jgi:hypothetical protein
MSKTGVMGCWALALLAATAFAAGDKFPKNKWFNGVKGYEQALEIQKATGADLFVYFAKYYPDNVEGLCRWWEKHSLSRKPLDDYLEGYIKVKIQLPLNKKDEEAIADFKVRKCPSVFVVQTNGFKNHCKVFLWPDGKPELIKPEDMIELLRARSGPRYQVTEGTEAGTGK